jgi:TatD DNase family protein
LCCNTTNHCRGKDNISNRAETDNQDFLQQKYFAAKIQKREFMQLSLLHCYPGGEGFEWHSAKSEFPYICTMQFIDTHTHLYLEEFDPDRTGSIARAKSAGVDIFMLPNIDSTSIDPLLNLADEYPENCFPMIGLHPTSVKDNYHDELKAVESILEKRRFYAIGEIGMDLYWDKTFLEQQRDVFRHQLKLAKAFNLPVAIHMRNCFEHVYSIIREEAGSNLRGVFHCFPGNIQQAKQVTGLGFYLGIGGVVTFKNSGLQQVVKEIPLEYILLETDAPFLAPDPYRGKRNESVYIPLIADKIATLKEIPLQEVAEITTANAKKLFNLI